MAKMVALRPWPWLLLLSACSSMPPARLADQAHSLRQRGELVQAYRLYGEALCAQPDNFAVARAMVECWRDVGKPGAATSLVAQCALHPAVERYATGLALAAAGDVEGADAALTEAFAAAPDSAKWDVAYRRGLLALMAGDPDRAMEQLEVAAGLAPESVEVRLAHAQTQLALKNPAQATAEIKALLLLRPTIKELERGRQILQAAVIAAQPPLSDNIVRTVNETLAALNADEIDRNLLLPTIAMAEQLSHPRVLVVAGMAAMRIGAQQEATRLLTLAEEMSPLDPDPPRVLGMALFAADRHGEALRPLSVAFERNPLDPLVATHLGEVAFKNGNLDLARAAYRAVTLLEPGHPDHYLGLARVERKLGNAAAAALAAQNGCAVSEKNIPLLMEWAVLETELTRKAKSAQERSAARERGLAAVERLLEVSPEHPGVDALLDALDRPSWPPKNQEG